MASKSNPKNKGGSPPNQLMLSRTLILMIVCGIAAFIVLVGKLYQIQIREHERYESAAIDQQVRPTTLSSKRGTIYDRNDKILAMSATVDTIYISPAEIAMYDEDPMLIAQSLSNILGVDAGKILDMAEDTRSWYKTVARKVDDELSGQVREFKNEYNLKGVKIETDSKRYYPYSSLACHVVGFVGYDNNGLLGIELSLDKLLTGSSGRIVRAKNAYGTDMLYTKYEDYYDAEDGYDVVLTVDTTVQYYMEKHLQQAMDDYGAKKAAAIAMDPNTGEVLGMVSLENFDLNDYQAVSKKTREAMESTTDPVVRESLLTQAQQSQWHNNAVEDMYEPGSTFKPFTVAMALEEGVVSRDSSIYCGGVYQVPGDRPDGGRHCWLRSGHGMQTLQQTLQHSCNVAMMQIAQKVGAKKYYEYVDAFGFNSKTGIELAGEAGSIWWDEELFCNPFNQTQLAAASFGQTFNITRMQLIRAMCAVVNGGRLMQPYLVKEVRDSEGNTVSKAEPTVIRQVISEETSATMREMLESVVGDMAEGTGKNAYVAGYRIGGKTGTSTDTVWEAQTEQKRYIISFIGFAPADDPKICILVTLENPDAACGVAVSGGAMGAPTVGNMMRDILAYLGVEPIYTEAEKKNIDRSVPTVTGLPLDEAMRQLQAQGLDYRTFGNGAVVTQQLPAPGTVVAAKSQILLYCGSQPSTEQELVPDLTGLTYEVARVRLGYQGLYVSTDFNNITDSNWITVKKQSIVPGTPVEHGTVIKVTLANSEAAATAQF